MSMNESQQPTPDTDQPEEIQPRRIPRGFKIALGVLVALAALVVIGKLSSSNPKSPTYRAPALVAAQTTCDPGKFGTTVADGNKTLVINGKGAEDTAGITVDAEVCILKELGVSSAATAHMESTRALDGRQSDAWGDYRASWSYHPDSGLDLVVQQS